MAATTPFTGPLKYLVDRIKKQGTANIMAELQRSSSGRIFSSSVAGEVAIDTEINKNAQDYIMAATNGAVIVQPPISEENMRNVNAFFNKLDADLLNDPNWDHFWKDQKELITKRFARVPNDREMLGYKAQVLEAYRYSIMSKFFAAASKANPKSTGLISLQTQILTIANGRRKEMQLKMQDETFRTPIDEKSFHDNVRGFFIKKIEDQVNVHKKTYTEGISDQTSYKKNIESIANSNEFRCIGPGAIKILAEASKFGNDKIKTEKELNDSKKGSEGLESFKKIYGDPDLKKSFLKFLKSEFAPENFEYILALEEKTKTISLLNADEMKELYDRYIKTNSEKEINISSGLRKKVDNAMKENWEKRSDETGRALMATFYEVRDVARLMLINEKLPTYFSSSYYKHYLLEENMKKLSGEIVKNKYDDANKKQALNALIDRFHKDNRDLQQANPMYQEYFNRQLEMAMMNSYLERKKTEINKSKSGVSLFFGMTNVDANYKAMQELKDTVKGIYDNARDRELYSGDLKALQDAYTVALNSRTGRNPGQTWDLIQKRKEAIDKQVEALNTTSTKETKMKADKNKMG